MGEMRRVQVGGLVIPEEDKRIIRRVLDSNQISPGRYCREFEQKFAKAHGAEHGLFVNSGTDALRIALRAMKDEYGWRDGSGVVVPAMTFVATVNVVLQCNLRPVLMDNGLDGFNVDRLNWFDECTKNEFYEGCVAIIPVHLFGKRVDLTGVKKFAKKHNLKIIEDSCETMGVGPIQGDVACYSTYVCHLISTGVGGLAITNDPKLHIRMRSLANHGRDPHYLPGYNSPEITKELIQKRFRFTSTGYSCRMTELEAVLGLQQLKRLPEMLCRRRVVAQKLIDGLERRYWNFLKLPFNVEENHAYMMFPIVVKKYSNIDRDDLCLFLEKNGIETRPLMPIINQPCYKDMNLTPERFPQAQDGVKNGFYIGCHNEMTDNDVKHVVDTFHKYFAKLDK